MNITSTSSTNHSAHNTGASSYSVINRYAPPGVAQDDWDMAGLEERLALIETFAHLNTHDTSSSSSELGIDDDWIAAMTLWYSRPTQPSVFTNTLLPTALTSLPITSIPTSEHAQTSTSPFPYSTQATQDTTTDLVIQFGLAQEMKVDQCKRTTYANPADVTIAFIGTVAPLSHTSVEGVIMGMRELRHEAKKQYKINSSAVGAFQFVNTTTTRTTAKRTFGETTYLKTIPFNGLTPMALFRQRFNESIGFRTKNHQKGMLDEWESLRKPHLNTNDYIREGAENKNNFFRSISAELAMDFIPYMEMGNNMKKPDGTLKQMFNPIRDEVYATYGEAMTKLSQSLEQKITPTEEKFFVLKDDERITKDVIDEYFSNGLSYTDTKGNNIPQNKLQSSWLSIQTMIDTIKKEIPDITSAQALHLIDIHYKEQGFVSISTFRVPFSDPMVKNKLSTSDIIAQARNYLSPEREPHQREEEIREQAIATARIMEEYIQLHNSTFEKLSLAMNNDPYTHTPEFWKNYNADAIKREEFGRRLIGLFENLSE